MLIFNFDCKYTKISSTIHTFPVFFLLTEKYMLKDRFPMPCFRRLSLILQPKKQLLLSSY